ncbi:MAG: hypothetical protein AAB729_02290 [Patescibacteria group bacterium]
MENTSAIYFLIVIGSYFIGHALYPLLRGEGFTINIPVFGTRFITGVSARVNGLLGFIIGVLVLTIPFYSKDNRTLVNIILVIAVIILNIIIQAYKVKKYKDRPGFSG